MFTEKACCTHICIIYYAVKLAISPKSPAILGTYKYYIQEYNDYLLIVKNGKKNTALILKISRMRHTGHGDFVVMQF